MINNLRDILEEMENVGGTVDWLIEKVNDFADIYGEKTPLEGTMVYDALVYAAEREGIEFTSEELAQLKEGL